MDPGKKYAVKSLARVLDVIDAISMAGVEGVGIGNIARQVGTMKSNAYGTQERAMTLLAHVAYFAVQTAAAVALAVWLARVYGSAALAGIERLIVRPCGVNPVRDMG